MIEILSELSKNTEIWWFDQDFLLMEVYPYFTLRTLFSPKINHSQSVYASFLD